MICIFPQIVTFVSVIFCLLVSDVLKIAFSAMDLLYNRIILYNRTINSLVLFIFTGVTFRVFDMIYSFFVKRTVIRHCLKALDIVRFSW